MAVASLPLSCPSEGWEVTEMAQVQLTTGAQPPVRSPFLNLRPGARKFGAPLDDVPPSGGEKTFGTGDRIPVQLASLRRGRVVAGTLVGSGWRSRAMEVSDR